MLGLGQILDQDGELVAAQPRDGIGLPQAAGETLGHDRQQAVAGDVAEAIVDRLEAVQVEDHDRDQALVAPRPGERALQPVLKQRAVGQPGQLVVLGQPAELIGVALPGQSVADGAPEPGRIEALLVEEIGDAERHRPEIELERAGARQHDDRRPTAALGGEARELETVAVGQRLIDQADVEPARAQPGAAPVSRSRAHSTVNSRWGAALKQSARGPEFLLVRLDQQDPDRAAVERRPGCGRHGRLARPARVGPVASVTEHAPLMGRAKITRWLRHLAGLLSKEPRALQNH